MIRSSARGSSDLIAEHTLGSAESLDVVTDCDIECLRSTPSTFPDMIGDQAHLVGDDIAAGVYRMGDGTEECTWGRVDDSGTVYEQIIEEGGLNADRTVHIRETDHGFYTFGCGIWTK